MMDLDIREYKSGYTTVRYAAGITPKSSFVNNVERYALRNTSESLMVYSIVETINASGLDILKALNLTNPDAGIQLVVNPIVKFSGNAFRFYSTLKKDDPQLFLMVTTTNISPDYFRGFVLDGVPHNAFFSTLCLPETKSEVHCRLYDELAMVFYRKLVLGAQEGCLLAQPTPTELTQGA